MGKEKTLTFISLEAVFASVYNAKAGKPFDETCKTFEHSKDIEPLPVSSQNGMLHDREFRHRNHPSYLIVVSDRGSQPAPWEISKEFGYSVDRNAQMPAVDILKSPTLKEVHYVGWGNREVKPVSNPEYALPDSMVKLETLVNIAMQKKVGAVPFTNCLVQEAVGFSLLKSGSWYGEMYIEGKMSGKKAYVGLQIREHTNGAVNLRLLARPA